MKSAAKVTLAGRPASHAEGFAKVSFNGAALAGALDDWRTWRRLSAGLCVEIEAGPSAFVVAETLGQANREVRTVEGYVTVEGLGAFEGVWTVPAIVHAHGEPSDMVVTLTPAPGTLVMFTPAQPKTVGVPAATPAKSHGKGKKPTESTEKIDAGV